MKDVNQHIKSLRSLKKGTKFKLYGKNDVEFIGIAAEKRGVSRDIKIEGREGTFSMRADNKVEIITKRTSDTTKMI